MFSTPPAKPASAKPRRAASSSGRPACSVKEKARQRIPEEEALWHLVARHLWREERGKLRLAHGLCALARHADGNADLAPERVGHAEHGDLADPGMGQYLLLDLTRIDVGAAGDVHVGSAAGDVDKPLFIDVAEIAGAEPAVAERFRVGLGVVVVACEHGRADHADLAGSNGFNSRPP